MQKGMNREKINKKLGETRGARCGCFVTMNGDKCAAPDRGGGKKKRARWVFAKRVEKEEAANGEKWSNKHNPSNSPG